VVTEPVVKPDVLVVGASSGLSLGNAIVNELADSEWGFGRIYTAGITDEEIRLDLLRSPRISEVLAQCRPDIIVCTVGINQPIDITDAFLAAKMHNSFQTNVTGPMDLLRHFIVSPVRPERGDAVKKFVAISSNSARIARRNSVAYCASKAALSMALRVAARELAPGGSVAVWGYEPGFLDGTPMTEEVLKAFYDKGVDVARPGVAMHRMPGVPPEGLPPADLARRIVQDLATFSYAHNGLIIPFDAGEQ
jgi:NAD(P)-dependent dehydrogenase (short-subunit alcohol dehydrogenase family)